jgi:hypothetical protein
MMLRNLIGQFTSVGGPPMALRIMLPSRAKVGDTVHFSFPHSPGKLISAFDVTINGKRVKDPEIVTNRAQNGGTANFVFHVREPGIYHFEIAPITEGGGRGEPRMNTLEVAAPSIGGAD